MFLVILQEDYFNNSGGICCLGFSSSSFFFFFFFLKSITPGAAYHSLQLLLHFGDKSLFPHRVHSSGNGDPVPPAILLSPRQRRCSGWSGFLPTIPRPSKKSDPKPHMCPSPPPALLLPGGVRERRPASRPLPWVETTYKWLNSDVMPSSA